MRICAILLAALGLADCHSSTPACNCPATVAPVCGGDGVTYQSDCFARCAGATVAATGSCSPNPSCSCDGSYALVCGVNGWSYVNRCTADCDRVAVAHDGECAYTPHAGSQACATDTDCGWIGLTCGGACFNKNDPPSQPLPCIGCPEPGCAGIATQRCYCDGGKCVDPFTDGLAAGAACDPARDLCQAGFLKCCGGDAGAAECVQSQSTPSGCP